jgi:hypothetical protein
MRMRNRKIGFKLFAHFESAFKLGGVSSYSYAQTKMMPRRLNPQACLSVHLEEAGSLYKNITRRTTQPLK